MAAVIARTRSREIRNLGKVILQLSNGSIGGVDTLPCSKSRTIEGGSGARGRGSGARGTPSPAGEGEVDTTTGEVPSPAPDGGSQQQEPTQSEEQRPGWQVERAGEGRGEVRSVSVEGGMRASVNNKPQ